MKYKVENKGFTLIELLVVIAIIGILAGILFVAIKPQSKIDDAKEKKSLHQLSQIRGKINMITNNFNFSEVKNDANINTLVDTIESNDISWAASTNLVNGGKACSDSSGYIGKDKPIIEMAFGKYFCSVGEGNAGGGEEEGGEEEGEGGGEEEG